MKLKFILNHLHNRRVLNIIQAGVTLSALVILSILGARIDTENAEKIAQQKEEFEKAIVVDVPEEEEVQPTESYEPDYVTHEQKIFYIDTGYKNLNVREEPTVEAQVIGKLEHGSRVRLLDELEDSDFVKIFFNGGDAFVHSDFISEEAPENIQKIQLYTGRNSKRRKTSSTEYFVNTTEYNQGVNSGLVLSSYNGTIQGPSGKETYYNLNMNRVVQNMKNKGFQGEYWVREDGAKMLGNFILVAANLNVHPRGSIVQTSMGLGLVADTGGFAAKNPTQIDIATAW